MKSRSLLAAPVVAALALTLAACGGQPGPSGASSAPPLSANAQSINAKARDQVSDGGELRLPIGSLADNWNPLNVDGNQIDYKYVLQPMTPVFFDFAPDATPTFNKNYLTKEPTATTTDGKLTVEFNLNPKATWNDGTKITVADFQATAKACNGADQSFNCASTDGYDQIESVTQGATESDVDVHFKATYPDWKAVFSNGPQRADSVATADVFNNGWKTLEGHDGWFSGPYKLGSYDLTSQIITLVPNDKWWGDKPKLDKVIFRVVPNEAVPAAYVNNEIDAFDIGINADALARAQSVTTGDIRKAAGPNWRHITLNQNAGLLTDKTIRQAILMSLDRQAIAASDLAGLNYDATVLNSHVFLNNQAQYKDLAKETGLGYDKEKAKSMLDQAGWVMGSDGYRAKNGKTLEVTFTAIQGVKVSENEAQAFQSQLKDAGIKVTIIPIASKDFGAALSKHTFQAIAFTWVGTQFPYPALNQFFNPKSSSDYSGYDNADVNALIAKVSTEMDQTKRDEYVLQAEKQIWTDVQIIPLYQRPDQWAVKSTVANYGAFGLGSPHWENIGFVK
ncbi:MAG TPA: ABC transporter family substrate-binding protein [Propionibacteriaceae bacterium]|nr:ABC transporter family substrate-binding protein [Propionibacteriaceae bacterium]